MSRGIYYPKEDAKLLLEKGINKICIIDKSTKIGGLIDTRFKKIKGKSSVKYEAGPAVLYSYQKNMLRLIDEYDISMFKIKLKHNSTIYHFQPTFILHANSFILNAF